MALSSIRVLIIVAFCLIFPASWGCSSYNQRIFTYYNRCSEGNFTGANEELERIKLLHRNRNKLLYLLEKGRVLHAMNQYDASNQFFNLADKYIEGALAVGTDVLAGTLVNPMMQNYRAADFEKIMMHYYKALNYLYLGQPDEAVVEARRIDLQTRQLEDKPGNKEKRYSRDAFSLMLQGMIYESVNDVNNAFIAYRNAAETYLKSESREYFGVQIPKQLKQDVLRTAYQNGFYDELSRFEKLFNLKYIPAKAPAGGELIVFWENGMAPVKEQQDFFFLLNRGAGGFYFTDRDRGVVIPFHPDYHFHDDHFDASDLNVFYVAFPRYVPRYHNYWSATISNSLDTAIAEKAEDINELATQLLKQRFLADMSLALSRIAVKRAAALLVKGTDKDSKKDKKVREGISKAIDLYSVFSEKPDTRNWQSLPSSVSYARLPLLSGKNDLRITLRDRFGKEESRVINIEGRGGLYFYNYASLK